MHRALVPYEITHTFVAMNPCLLPTFLTMYGSEVYINFELLASCFLSASTPGANKKSADVFDAVVISVVFLS